MTIEINACGKCGETRQPDGSPLGRDAPECIRHTQLSTAARHSSESNEHYTPVEVVEAARATLQDIDLDPASCEFANTIVQAKRIFTAEDDGFIKEWAGTVFLNPPGGLSDDQQRPVKQKCRETGSCGLPLPPTHEGVESSQKKWWFKLAEQFQTQRVTSAIFVGFSLEILQVTQSNPPLGAHLPLHFPLCFPSARVKYDHEADGARVSGKSPPHASVIVCVSQDEDVIRRFFEAFEEIGLCIDPDTWGERHAHAAAAYAKNQKRWAANLAEMNQDDLPLFAGAR